jgi:hypothetical protein
MQKKGKGWYGNPTGHAKASKGISVRHEFPVKIVSGSKVKPITMADLAQSAERRPSRPQGPGSNPGIRSKQTPEAGN